MMLCWLGAPQMRRKDARQQIVSHRIACNQALIGIDVLIRRRCSTGIVRSLVAAGSGAALLLACATSSSQSTAPSAGADASPEVTCNRARVSAYDGWQRVELELQHHVAEVRKAIVETDDRHLPPAWMITKEMFAKRDAARAAAPRLEAQLAAATQARESSLLGAVYARDAANAAATLIPANEAQQLSTAAWTACKDIAPGSPAPPSLKDTRGLPARH